MHLSHITLVLALACLVPERADAEIVLQTENLRLEIGSDGTVARLVKRLAVKSEDAVAVIEVASRQYLRLANSNPEQVKRILERASK